MAEARESISEKLKTLPRKPGVYIMKASGERVIYVGKARDLRLRVGSYFQPSADLDMRKAAMVRLVRDFSFLVTSNELEALALEANLIKQHKPRFNVLLRDDKNYPYLRLTVRDQWPRLEVVRRIQRDGSLYFGPYVPAAAMWETLHFVNRHFGLRPCKYSLDKPMRPCVQHQMGRCPAPCAGLVDHGMYMRAVDEVAAFLRGRRTELLRDLEALMREHSDAMRYEEAARVRDRIAALRHAWESQRVISAELGDLDVVGLHEAGGVTTAQVLFIRNGVMIGARAFHMRDLAGAPAAELLHEFAVMLYSKGLLPPPEVVMPAVPEDAANLAGWLTEKAGRKVRITAALRGRKAGLLDMARDNARQNHESRAEGEAGAAMKALAELRDRLGVDFTPRSIGAFDVSNLTGTDPVGAYVYWADGDFVRDNYRRLRIRHVQEIDDYAMMRETVSRVLSDAERPDLVLIDGGRGHLSAALEAVEVLDSTPLIVALAKKPDRLFMEGAEEPLTLDDRAASSLLLRRIRDEVHRFAVSYHRNLRQGRTMRSQLESIAGIGKKRRLLLLRQFGSLEGIRDASVQELASVKGITRPVAEAIHRAFHEEADDDA